MPRDIMIVDDEADIRAAVAGILEDEGYASRGAASADAALAEIDRRPPSLVLLDIWLEGSRMDGLQLLEQVAARHPGLPVVMISGHGTIETAVAAIRIGAYDFIEKPFQADRLLLVVERALEAARLRRELAELRLRVGHEAQIIGTSHHAAHLRSQIEKAAPTGSRVLIMGPPGTGKEVAARALHAASRRADGPFVVLNCAAMAPDRLELELFGTEAGVAGGPRKVGLLEQAHGGTLLLDEVADMPLETQGKIVRVLQDQTFERVGGGTRVSVDVRVVSTSNRDLQAEMAAGLFRQDFFYRLNVVTVRVPPLVERREDIPQLARHFMVRAAESAGVVPRSFGEDALAAFQTYPWPGNIRQLRNVIDWLLIMAADHNPRLPIRADMLPPEITQTAPALARWEGGSEIMAMPLREARETFEREYLVAQVARFGGNISRTAAFIGMERSALHRKLKLLGITTGDRNEG